jgi:hypothetical protein
MVFLGLVLCLTILLVSYGCGTPSTSSSAPTTASAGKIKMGGVAKYSYYRDGNVIGYLPNGAHLLNIPCIHWQSKTWHILIKPEM